MKLGLILPVAEYRMDGETPGWDDLLAMTRQAEAVGFDSVWVVDHLIVASPGQETIGVWECWSLLSALATSTHRLELGTLVTCTGFRNPALLAKMAETVDEISNGRLILGLGAGNHEPEYRAFGFLFDHRVSRFEEAIQIISGLLREGHVSFEGTYYQAQDCVLRPRGPRSDGLPIMVGTTGPRMLGLTAKFADAWNVYFNEFGNTVDRLKPVLEKVDVACEKAGRDASTLERSASVIVGMQGQSKVEGVSVPPMTGSTEEMVEELLAYRELGMAEIQVRLEPNTVESVQAFAPVVEQVVMKA